MSRSPRSHSNLSRLILILALLLYTFTCPSQSKDTRPGAPSTPPSRHPSQEYHRGSSDDVFDDELDDSVKEDREKLSTREFLEKHGLGDVTQSLSAFVHLFDKSTILFSRINTDEQFEVLNRVIGAFKGSLVETLNEAFNAHEPLSGVISLTAMKDFLNRQEVHFNEKLKRDKRILESEWATFLAHTHVIFDSLKRLYQLSLENRLPLSWWMLKMTSPIIEKVPSDFFDRETFSSLLEIPEGLQQTVHEVLEGYFESDYGPMIKFALQMMSSYYANRHEHQEV